MASLYSSTDSSHEDLIENIISFESMRACDSRKKPKVYKKRVDVFQIYDDEQFKTKYRFTKATARYIIELLRPLLVGDNRGGKVPVELMVMSAIRTWCRHKVSFSFPPYFLFFDIKRTSPRITC